MRPYHRGVSLDDIAMHLGVLDIEFTVLEPAELRSRVEAIAGRFHRAAQRAAEATVPVERRGVQLAQRASRLRWVS